MVIIFIALSGLWFSSAASTEGIQISQWPSDIRVTLDRAVKVANQTYTIGAGEYPGIRIKRVEENAQLFDETLAKLARQLDKARCERSLRSEGINIYEKLAAIACDRVSHYADYELINQTYIQVKGDPQSQFQASPRLSNKHAIEQYRLAWEYFLLAPPQRGTAPLYDFRVVRALGMIKNDATILTLLYCFRITTQPGAHPGAARNRQRLLLEALNYFSNEPALRAMLECLSLSEQQEKETGQALWDVKGYVYKLLSDQENYGNAEQWRKAITDFLKGDLPPNQRELLESALRILKKSGG